MKNEDSKTDFSEVMESVRERVKSLPVRTVEQERAEFEKFRQYRWSSFYSQVKNLPANCHEIKLSDLDFEKSPSLQHLKVWDIDDKFGFVFHGAVGTGKTHAMIAMMNRIVLELVETEVDPCQAVQFWPLPRYIEALKREMNHADSEKRIADSAARVPFLFIDDLGAENVTDWAGEQIMALLDARVRFHKATFISTNGSAKSLADALGLRVSSRMKELGVFIEVMGDDRRNDAYRRNVEILKRRRDSV